MSYIEQKDPELYDVIQHEEDRQRNTIELIASENIVSQAVREAQGSVLTNKYAEGYPGHRYYGGCEFVDMAENLAIDRAKELFGAEYANVQPHSGSGANMAAYRAFLKDGDRVMGWGLQDGGHLTHGAKVSFSGQEYDFQAYGLNPETERLDYDQILAQAKAFKPKMIVTGASAYSREIDFSKFRDICDEVGAYLMVDMAHIAGLVAAGIHQSPVPYADVVTTTTHKTLRGPRGGLILAKAEYGKAINSAVFPGIQGGPLEHVIAAKAICLKEALDPSFKEYAKQIVKNAKAMAEVFDNSDEVRVISGGTDNHLMLLDVTKLNMYGRDVQDLLDTVHITLNKNTIPNEQNGPFKTSGVRVGTPAITTRGFKEAQAQEVAELILKACRQKDDAKALAAIDTRVKELTAAYPIPD